MSIDESPPPPPVADQQGAGVPEVPAAVASPVNGASPVKAKRKHPRWLIALEVLTVLIVVAPFVAEAISSHRSTSSAPAGQFGITVMNDAPAAVTLRACGTTCQSSDPSSVLTASASTNVRVSGRGEVTRFEVLDGSGAVMGCLPLRFTSPVAGVTVRTSAAVACPGSPLSLP